MVPACTTQAGQCMAVPDVCKTPSPAGPVPIPYVNLSSMPMATGTSLKVFVLGMPAVTMKSKIPISSGDEAGVAGGVVSGVNMNETSFSKGSSTVMVEGMPWVHLGAPTRQNGASPNCVGAVIAPSQTKVLVTP